MHRLTLASLAIVLLPVLVLVAGNAGAAPPSRYDSYAAALETYVSDQGLVNYKGLQADTAPLDTFTSVLATLDPQTYEQWDGKEKIALLVNAYNAFTLTAILAHYPIAPSFLASLRFPRNSIRQIPGVWDRLTFSLMGRKVTLDEIEHQMLRKQFDEPRIHVALVCAAMGCPPLRNEPYTGEKLDVQLADQTRRFLNDRRKFHIDRGAGRVQLSPIFQWYGEDFVTTYNAGGKFPGRSESEGAVLNFVSRHLNGADRDYLTTGKYVVAYLDYDWSLNDQSSPPP